MALGLLQGIEDYRWDMPKLQIIGSIFIYISSVLKYTGDTLDKCVLLHTNAKHKEKGGYG